MFVIRTKFYVYEYSKNDQRKNNYAKTHFYRIKFEKIMLRNSFMEFAWLSKIQLKFPDVFVSCPSAILPVPIVENWCSDSCWKNYNRRIIFENIILVNSFIKFFLWLITNQKFLNPFRSYSSAISFIKVIAEWLCEELRLYAIVFENFMLRNSFVKFSWRSA